MPTPRPQVSVTSLARGEAGQEDQVEESRLRRAARAPRVDQRRARSRCARSACASMPRPSSSTSITTWLPFCERVRARSCPSRGLPARARSLGRLDAVIDRVAHHVHQRIEELLDDQLVELGLGAGDHEPDLLAEPRARSLAHDARQLVEHLAERHHAHLEDAAPAARRACGRGCVHLRAARRRARAVAGLARSRARSTRDARARWIASSPTMFISWSSLRMSTRTVSLTDLQRLELGRLAAARRSRRASSSPASAQPPPQRRRSAAPRALGRARPPRRAGRAATLRTAPRGSSSRAARAPPAVERRSPTSSEKRICDSRRVAAARAASRAPRRPRATALRELREALLERSRMSKARLDERDAQRPRAHVLAQPVLLVLGEHAQQRRRRASSRARSRPPARGRAPGVDARDRAARRARSSTLLERRRRRCRRSAASSCAEQLDRLERAGRARRRVERDPAEAQVVEQRPRGGARARRCGSSAEQAREPLQRVHRAEERR